LVLAADSDANAVQAHMAHMKHNATLDEDEGVSGHGGLKGERVDYDHDYKEVLD
jgi:hypothetical protein